MAINLKDISQLRDRTGAGVSDCQKALMEAGGDLEKAIEILRKKGEIKAAKKAERQTKEGVIALKNENGKLAVVALACETDFVARNQDFIDAVAALAQQLLISGQENFSAWAEAKIKNDLIIKIGENIQLINFELIDGPVMGFYLHPDRKLASVVILNAGRQLLADELAMQIAALAPKYLRPEEIPAAELEKEKEIYRSQLQQANKPEAIWDKIIAGKLDKYYEEVCLLNQKYIKDDSQTINDWLKAASQDQEIKVEKFWRFQI